LIKLGTDFEVGQKRFTFGTNNLEMIPYFEGRVYQFKAMPFGLASAPLIFQSIIKAFVAPLPTSFLPRRLASPQHLQGHSEITDDVTHQECQIGQMDYERGEYRK
jgi:hypothetical protein